MKIIILIALSYFLCKIIKPLWKAFVAGVSGYIIISYLITIASVPNDAKLNVTWISFYYFAADALGEFLVYFIIGLGIFSILNRSNDKKSETTENSIGNESKDNINI
jgi:ABC-type Mn2+/Zn2+ transport system permease subunit